MNTGMKHRKGRYYECKRHDKKSVLESGVFDQYNISSILVALAAALALGILIFLVYRRFLYRRYLFKNFCSDSGRNDSSDLYGNAGDQHQCCNFTWYGWCTFYCPFSYCSKRSNGSFVSAFGRSPRESRQEPECMCWRFLQQQL